MKFKNIYFINGNAYAGKSTMVKMLAKHFNGIFLEENYHDIMLDKLDKNKFPALTYTRDLEDFRDFIRRTPDEYEKWIIDVTKECEVIELQILESLIDNNKPIFVDTNISIETLYKISDNDHVLIMLADPLISVNRFFDRPDREKQYLYKLLLNEENSEKKVQEETVVKEESKPQQTEAEKTQEEIIEDLYKEDKEELKKNNKRSH